MFIKKALKEDIFIRLIAVIGKVVEELGTNSIKKLIFSEIRRKEK